MRALVASQVWELLTPHYMGTPDGPQLACRFAGLREDATEVRLFAIILNLVRNEESRLKRSCM